MIREPYVSLHQVLTAYTRFHTKIEPYRSGFVTGTFDEVTTDFGRVILANQPAVRDRLPRVRAQRVQRARVLRNHRGWVRRPPWSTALGQFECGVIGIADYRRTVASYRERGEVPSMDVPERRVQRPSEERTRLKHDLRTDLG